jgi:hypothetical protein
MELRRRLLAIGLFAAVALAADQAADRIWLSDGLFLQRRVAPFDPPVFGPAQWRTLEDIEAALAAGEPPPGELRFDRELGWCPRPDSGSGEFRYDWAGSRIGSAPLERTRPDGVRRIVAVGCSMTHGEEVAARETWCAQLDDALPGLEVANLGVGAFGLDQALLRVRRDAPRLEPDEVWLGWMPEASLRPTTLYRPALRHWAYAMSFKPRFVLRGEELVLVPNPARDLADTAALVRSQERFLAAVGEHDLWVRRSRAAYLPFGASWLHRSFATRLLLSAWEVRGRDPADWFDDADGEVPRLIRALVRATAAESAALGARFRLLVLPSRSDLEGLARRAEGYWEPLCRALAAEGIEVFDPSRRWLADGVLASEGFFAPQGHYGPGGGRVLAEALTELVGG